jgi:hypothetical protein
MQTKRPQQLDQREDWDGRGRCVEDDGGRLCEVVAGARGVEA